jgi:hypothetical protein
MATGYGLDGKILFFTMSRPTMGSTQPPIQYVPGAISLEVKREIREANRSPPPSAEIKKGGATPPLQNMPSWHNK